MKRAILRCVRMRCNTAVTSDKSLQNNPYPFPHTILNRLSQLTLGIRQDTSWTGCKAKLHNQDKYDFKVHGNIHSLNRH